MKIEMGESLCASWLKHVKKCQVVQTNWKPSCFWDESTFEFVKKMLIDLDSKLGKYGFSHKKGKGDNGERRDLGIDARQIIGMTECDVVGVRFNGDGSVDQCYGMESAFHSDGLHYKATVKKVVAKLIRAIVALHLYLGAPKIEVGFMTPKIKIGVLREISNLIPNIKKVFEENKLEVTIKFYTDIHEEEYGQTQGILSFRKEIFIPLVKCVPFADDDSELFMRSVLMSELCQNNSLPVRSSLRAAIRSLACTLEDIEESGDSLAVKIDNASEKSAFNGYRAWRNRCPLLKDAHSDNDQAPSNTRAVRKQTESQQIQKGVGNGL